MDGFECRYVGGLYRVETSFYEGNFLDIRSGCDNAIIKNCIIEDVFDAGVSPQFASTWGYVWTSLSNVKIEGNRFIRCGLAGVESVLQQDNTDSISGITIEKNYFEECGRGQFGFASTAQGNGGGIAIGQSGASNISALNTNYIVRYNEFKDCQVIGGDYKGPFKIDFYGNLCTMASGKKVSGDAAMEFIWTVNNTNGGTMIANIYGNIFVGYDVGVGISDWNTNNYPVELNVRYNHFIGNTVALHGKSRSNVICRISNNVFYDNPTVAAGWGSSTFITQGGNYVSTTTTLGFTAAGTDATGQAAPSFNSGTYVPVSGSPLYSGGVTGFAAFNDPNGEPFTSYPAARGAYAKSGFAQGVTTGSIMCIGDSLTQGNGDGGPSNVVTKRWFPGHYAHAHDGVLRNGLYEYNRNLVKNNSNFVGYHIWVFWGQTEVTQGDYSALYTQLNTMRDAAIADNKKIWLRLYDRSFVGSARPRPMPLYIEQAGWTYTSTASGQNLWAPKLWVPGCSERYLLWAEKVAEYCAANEQFVLLSSEEWAMFDSWNQAGWDPYAFDNHWKEFARRITPKAGNCLVWVNSGWSNSTPGETYAYKKALMDYVVAQGCGLGPTDIRKDNNEGSATLSTAFGQFIFNLPTHPTFPGFKGKTFFCGSYEWPDYNSVESPAEHLRWAVDDMGYHFIAWDPDKNTGSSTAGDWKWSDALAAVNAQSGRINTAKPETVQVNSTVFLSYRYALQNLMKAANIPIDFIGPQNTGAGGGDDPDQAGYGGNTIQNIIDKLDNTILISQYQPAIIILFIGWNDVMQNLGGEPIRFSTLYNNIRTKRPNAKIVLCTLTKPNTGESPALWTALNSHIRSLVTSNASTTKLADLATINFISTDLADYVHFAAGGAEKVAAVIYSALTLNNVVIPSSYTWDGKKIPDAMLNAALDAADAAAQGSKTLAFSNKVVTDLSASFKRQLLVDGSVVYESAHSGLIPVNNNALVYPTTGSKILIIAAAINTGTWLHRLVNSTDPTKQIVTPVYPVSSSSTGGKLTGNLEANGDVTFGEFKVFAPMLDNPLDDTANMISHMTAMDPGIVLNGAPDQDHMKGGHVVMGADIRAVSTPSWWDGYNYSDVRTWWDAIRAAYTIWAINGHQTGLNTRVVIREVQIWAKLTTSTLWQMLQSIVGPDGAPIDRAIASPGADPTERRESDNSLSIKLAADGRAYQGFNAPITVDAANIECIQVRVVAKKILDNPAAADDRHQARYAVRAHFDVLPFVGITTSAGNSNGVWMDVADLLGPSASTYLQECVNKEIFNIYWSVGYPSPVNGTITFPSLSGFVPNSEIGILVTQSQVQTVVALLASIDTRLKLWAWFGTWSTDNGGGDDATGHLNARININTPTRRSAVIAACMTVANWGFYGIQDDTEDFLPESLEGSGQYGSTYVTFTNEFAIAAHNAGLKYIPFIPSVWYNFNDVFLEQITQPDQIIMAGHNSSDLTEWNTLTALFFANAQKPVIYNFGYPGVANNMATRLDSHPYSSVASRIAGYSWYLFQDWHNNWNIWDNWRQSHSVTLTHPGYWPGGCVSKFKEITNEWTTIYGTPLSNARAIDTSVSRTSKQYMAVTSFQSNPPPGGVNEGEVTSGMSSIVETAITDMGNTTVSLIGAPVADWNGGGMVVKGADLRSIAQPSWWSGNNFSGTYPYWSWLQPWFVIWDLTGHVNGLNTMVAIEEMQVWMLYDTGPWVLERTATPDSADLFERDYDGPSGGPTGTRMGDGALAFRLNPSANYIAHGYGASMNIANPGSVKGIQVRIRSRKILENTSGTDDRTSAKYAIQAGVDAYPAANIGLTEMGASYNPGLHSSRFVELINDGSMWTCATNLSTARVVSTAYAWNSRHTMTEAAFRASVS
jgi:hypothetical protein